MVASASASFCVEGVGTARLAEVTESDVGKRLEAFHALTHFGAAKLF